MGSAHARRLNLIALVVLLVALVAGTGAARPRPAGDQQRPARRGLVVRERGRPARAVRRRHGRRPGHEPHRPLGARRRVAALLDVRGPGRRQAHRHRPLDLGRAPAALLRTAARMAAGDRDARLGGAGAQPGVRGAHHPRHLRAGARPGVQAAGGRAGRARLGGEPRRGEHLVHHPPVRPRRPHHRAPRVGAGGRGEGAPRRRPLALRPVAGRRDRGGPADALPGRPAGGRRGGLRARRPAPAGSRRPPRQLVAAAPGAARGSARRRRCWRRGGGRRSSTSAPSSTPSPPTS